MKSSSSRFSFILSLLIIAVASTITTTSFANQPGRLATKPLKSEKISASKSGSKKVENTSQSDANLDKEGDSRAKNATNSAELSQNDSSKLDKIESLAQGSQEESEDDSEQGSTGTTESTALKLRSPFEPLPESDDNPSADEIALDQPVVETTNASSSHPDATTLEDGRTISVVTDNPSEKQNTSRRTRFEPVEDIEEEALQTILPGKLYPRVALHGYFRARTYLDSNFDLDTLGSSAVLPLLDTMGPLPANPTKSIGMGANMRLHLAPTLHITDEIKIVSEFDVLDNVSFGDSPERRLPAPFFTPYFKPDFTSNTQFSLPDSIKIRQLYGQIDTLFGSLYAGRIDSHFGLGLQDNNGDCIHCDYGTSIDRVMGKTSLFGINAALSYDFPDEGYSTQTYPNIGGQAYDLAQIDDVDQVTAVLTYQPSNDRERLLEQKKLLSDGEPVYHAGLLFRWRNQDGSYATSPSQTASFPSILPTLIYKGLTTYTFDAWGEFLYHPNDKLKIRLGLEGFVHFGSIANISDQPVGQATDRKPAVDCFNDDTAKERCRKTVDGKPLSRDIFNWGFALESDFKINELITFGLYAGAASGGSTPNWGVSGVYPDYDFAQFNRDYHVDLILFRHVIGTVTNAAYIKPYIHFEFLKAGNRYLEASASTIFSLALNKEGTPSGERMLGTEIDANFAYVLKDLLRISIDGGILFPFEGLHAKLGRPRYQRFDSKSPDFTEDRDASIAWTLQGSAVLQF